MHAMQVNSGTLSRKALDVLRTGTPMTGADIASAALAANNVTDADSKGVQTLAQAIQAGLRNHAGEGVQRVGEGVPAKWRLTAN
jgi:hypothetical protein